jgi:hypothetical protein
MKTAMQLFIRQTWIFLFLTTLVLSGQRALGTPTAAVFLSATPGSSSSAYSSYQVIEGGAKGVDTAYLIFWRDTTSGSLKVYYTVSGTVSNSDYSSSIPLTNSITIPSGTNMVSVTLKALSDVLSESTETLTVTLTSSSTYTIYSGIGTTTLQILDGTPLIGVLPINSTLLVQGKTGGFGFFNDNPYSLYASNITVKYTVSGTASNGVDYLPRLTNSIVIPSGTNLVYANITATLYTNLVGTKTVTVSVVTNFYLIETNDLSATVAIIPDAPVISVAASASYAYGNGSSGQFTVARSGGSGTNLTVHLAVGGTAIAGTDYVAIQTNVTLAAGVTSTNLTVALMTNVVIAAPKTVVLGLLPDALYLPGLDTNAVITFLPASSTSNVVTSPVGRYWRGSGSDPTYWSQVIPLDYEKGMVYSNLNGNAGTLYSGLSSWSSQTFYHYNATNTLTQTNAANRIAFNNPIVAFGERVGGTPLYISQPYSFGIYAGASFTVYNGTLETPLPIIITVYYRTNTTVVAGYIHIDSQHYYISGQFYNTSSGWNPSATFTDEGITYSTLGWDGYVTNGYWVTTSSNYLANGVDATTNTFGLKTVMSSTPKLNWGVSAREFGQYVLTHTADSDATNYVYLVSGQGTLTDATVPMVMDSNGTNALSLLYTLEFAPRPAWRSVYLDQSHFDGSPLPPFYAGMTVDEILTNTPPVTNAVNFTPSSAMTLDNSPELRRHPVLDQFVADMNNDPIALANYVINQVELTDPMDYSDSGTVAEQAINPPGVSRGALGTFLEKQGSPIEQCALLVYLLRQAGVPAVYEFAPRNGLKLLDTRLSQLLKFQVTGSYNEAGQLYTTNTMIAVNYPWVAAYIGDKWVHIFPWLKDHDLVEGLDLWDYMPAQYPSAYSWIKDYIYGKTNLLSLAVDGDNTPRVIFPMFLKQTLAQNHPGVSVDDIGMQIVNRQHCYSRWADFPTPTWLTNVSVSLESLTASGITNISPSLTNVFDTLSVEIYSVNDPTKRIQTGNLRLVDLHNRQFYIYQALTNTTQVQLSLILMPFRTNITTQFAFANDTNLLSKEVLSLTLDQYDDELTVRFRYHRHRALSDAYGIDPNLSFLGYSALDEVSLERPLHKGDQAAICMSCGLVTRDMLNLHATDLWQMEKALKLDPTLTNSLSPDVYLGTPMYLAGMTYYQKVGEFRQVNQLLHKINILSSWAIGLSKISAARNSSGSLTNGVDPVLPNVDMCFYETAWTGNASVRPDSGQTAQLAGQNCFLIDIADISAEEHQALNRFYRQTNAVSTVRLLQLASSQSSNGIVLLNMGDSYYANQGAALYQGTALKNWDSDIWSQVVAAFQNSSDGKYVTAYMTPGPITNSAFKGMGALVLGWNQWQALISPGSLNGGFGEYFASYTMTRINALRFDLNGDNDYKLALSTPVSGTRPGEHHHGRVLRGRNGPAIARPDAAGLAPQLFQPESGRQPVRHRLEIEHHAVPGRQPKPDQHLRGGHGRRGAGLRAATNASTSGCHAGRQSAVEQQHHRRGGRPGQPFARPDRADGQRLDHQLHALWRGRQHAHLPGDDLQQWHPEPDPALPATMDGQPGQLLHFHLRDEFHSQPNFGEVPGFNAATAIISALITTFTATSLTLIAATAGVCLRL